MCLSNVCKVGSLNPITCLECGKTEAEVEKQGGCNGLMKEGYKHPLLSIPEKAQYKVTVKDDSGVHSLEDWQGSKSALDTQVGGGHYKTMKIQPVEFIVANNIPYREANVIKYTTRHVSKNGKEDIKKAIHYLEMILEEYNGE